MLEYGSRKTWRRWMADRWVNTGLELVFIHERCKMQYIQRNVVPHLGRIGTGRSRNLRDNKHCIELTSPGRLLWSGLDSLNTRVVNHWPMRSGSLGVRGLMTPPLYCWRHSTCKFRSFLLLLGWNRVRCLFFFFLSVRNRSFRYAMPLSRVKLY